MRIAFVAANREQLPDPVIPLGLLQILESTSAEHGRDLLDLCFEDQPEAALAAFIDDVRPHLVAISLRNLHDNDYGPPTANVERYRRLVEVVRGTTDAPIVLGGGGYSLMPRRLLEALGADYGIAGEGEQTFASLVSVLADGGNDSDLDRIGGLHRRVGKLARSPPGPAPLVDLASLPFADRRRVDRRHYERCGIESVQTRRGCPMRCSYCTYPRIEGGTARLRPPALVADELAHIREAAPAANHFFIVDSVFNLPASHAIRVCDAIRERGIGLPWTCYVNPADFGPQLAERMVAAGCVGAEIGSDSGVDSVLCRLRKGFGTTHIRRTGRVARAAGLLDCHTFLLGTPGETLDEVERTLDLIGELDPFAAILMVWNDEADVLVQASPARLELRERILALLDARRRHHPRWVVPALGHRFDRRRFRLLRRRGLRGPLWQHLA